MSHFLRVSSRLALLLFCLSAIWPSQVARAQSGDNLAEIKQQADALIKQNRYTEAMPLLEKIVAAEPKNAEMHFYLGFALIGKANSTIDDKDRQALRIRARNAFIRSKELGNHEPLLDAMIGSMDPNGSDGPGLSKNISADALMTQAESFYAQGKLDEALKNYQKALQLDPGIYEAALFSGDVYMTKGDFNQAETWYQKAIAINPNREIAYRYSATPLMKQGKTEEARNRYIEAFIVEPYSRFSRTGLIQWAQITGSNLAHPEIDIPTKVTFDEKGEAKIDLDASVLLGGKDDGSFAWISYGATRTGWHKEKFAKEFPREKSYRHSLAEEADALRSVITMATADKKTKKLSTVLAKLKKLNDEGLLEAYILLALPDQGIAEDHPAYLKQNRDKLRRYMIAYVLTGGGN